MYDPNARNNEGGPYQPYPPARNQRPRRSSILWLAALIVGILLFVAGWAVGHAMAAPAVGALQPSASPQATVPALTGNNISTVREAVINKVRPEVVLITISTPQGTGLGSGVIIDNRGYIVTNNHVVSGARTAQVTLYDGTKADAQISGTDPADDLAVIKITPPAKGMAVATLGDSSKLAVGADVLAIGNPLGITQTVTNGIVSALGRTVSEGPGGAVIPNAIQTDAPINPGNSGGALVDLQGNLVGIPTLTAIDPEFNTPANGVGFAIPSNRVSFIVPQIIQSGKVTHTGRAALGISGATVDQNLQAQDNLSVDHGVLIANLVSGGAAEKAGLQAGDVIVQVGNTQVADNSTLVSALITYSPGQTVPVKVYRGNQQLTINVTLGELQSGS